MTLRWIRPFAFVLVLVFSADLALADRRMPRWVSRIDAGSVVQVTTDADAFDAVWMGLDGDRAVFERFPHDTISVPLDTIRSVKVRRSQTSSNSAVMGAVGAVAGFFGTAILIGIIIGAGR